MLFHLPIEPAVSVELFLFRDVTNSGEIRSNLSDQDVQAAVIDAQLVPSSFCVLCAAHNAVCKYRQGSLVTKGVHSELIYNLSASRNISRALSTFGISSTTEDVLLAVIDANETIVNHIQRVVRGVEILEVDKELKARLDIGRVAKAYGLSQEERKWYHNKDTWKLLVNAVATRISARDLR